MKLELDTEPDIFRKRLERQDSRLKGKERKRYRKAFRIAMSAFGMVVHNKFLAYMNERQMKVATPFNRYNYISAFEFILNRRAKIRILLPYYEHDRFSAKAITMRAKDFLEIPDSLTRYHFMTRYKIGGLGGFNEVVPELFESGATDNGAMVFFKKLLISELELVRVYNITQTEAFTISVAELMGVNVNTRDDLLYDMIVMWSKLLRIG